MAGYNRYQGNTGRFVRIEPPETQQQQRGGHAPAAAPHHEPQRERHREPQRAGNMPDPPRMQNQNQNQNHQPSAQRRPGPPPAKKSESGSPLGMLGSIQETLSGILPKVMPDGLETEDLLLLLILYLMYKESGDKELLVIMGAMFFL